MNRKGERENMGKLAKNYSPTLVTDASDAAVAVITVDADMLHPF